MSVTDERLIIRWETGDLMEADELGSALTALSTRFYGFVGPIPAELDEPSLKVAAVKDGSIIVEFVGLVAGLMGDALTIREFYSSIKTDMTAYLTGKLPRDHSPSKARDYAEIVKAVAEADSSTGVVQFALRERTADGDEIAFAFSKGDSKQLLSNVISITQDDSTLRAGPIESQPRRAFLRLYQHNLDPSAGGKKRTQHKAIVEQYSPRPKALLYQSQDLADELNSIVSQESYVNLLFDVTLKTVTDSGLLKAYRLVEIHTYFDDDPSDQQLLLGT